MPCGTLTPEIAGIIYDEAQLRAELFVNPAYLSAEKNQERFLPLPERVFSSVLGWNGALTGSTQQNPLYTVTNEAIHAFGEGKFITQSTFSDHGLRFDQAATSVERNGWAATGGLFRSRGTRLLSDRDMAGVGFSTSLMTRLDNRKMEGSDILLYLARRSFVSLYRDGRLYSSQVYEAGNQYIDTSALPEGAYTITLKIQEIDGAVREERRYFAKSPDLPPPDAPVYYAQGGVLREPADSDAILPRLSDKPIIRAGTVRRLDDNLGLDASMVGLNDRVVSETGLFWMHDGAQVRGTFLGSSSGDFGMQASLLYIRDAWAISADAMDMHAADNHETGLDAPLSTLRQATARVSYIFDDDFTLGLRGNYSKIADAPRSFSFGPFAEWRVWQQGESDLSMSADVARIDRRTQGNVFLRFTHRFGDYGISGSASSAFGRADNGPTGTMRAWHDQRDRDRMLLLGADVAGDRENQSVGVDADFRNSVGEARGSLQKSWGQGGGNFSYGGDFAVGMAQYEVELHLGGSYSDKSAVIVSAKGDSQMPMKIFVNGVERSSVTVGSSQVLYLPPFRTYRIQLGQDGAGFLDFDAAEKKVTLYPGNVSKLTWEMRRVQVVIGHVRGADGVPLANALLRESKAQVTTSEKGRFQAELPKLAQLTFQTANGESCQVKLPGNVKAARDIIVYREPLSCSPISEPVKEIASR